jgi:hypothetical protein
LNLRSLFALHFIIFFVFYLDFTPPPLRPISYLCIIEGGAM